MKTRAVRLYGVNDLRLEEFELPEMRPDEILASVVTNSICMSSHKAAVQGRAHKRVPEDIAEHPVIMGHEFCGEIVRVGEKWRGSFSPGDRFTIQPALNYLGSLDAPGYSYRWIGGNARTILIPNEVMETDSLLRYRGEAFFMGSLAEPVSCILGAFHAQYHTRPGSYVHEMGIIRGGRTAILAGGGPMGLGAIDYALHAGITPKLLVVTGRTQWKLDRAAELYPVEEAARLGVELLYVNISESGDPRSELHSLTGGEGFDDIFVMAPGKALVELADSLLGRDGCLNFFAGPNSSDFTAAMNFYHIHYSSHHVVGTSGGNTDDMREAISLMEQGRINPAAMVTHIGGLDSVSGAIRDLPELHGGKKLIYTQIDMPLTAIEDFSLLGKEDSRFAELDCIVKKTRGLWSLEAEQFLLESWTQQLRRGDSV